MTESPGFTCPLCGRVSHNLRDAAERFCGKCGFVDDQTLEFECADCGASVVRYGAGTPPPYRCAGCTFLTWIEDADKREAMRRHMLKTGTIGPA